MRDSPTIYAKKLKFWTNEVFTTHANYPSGLPVCSWLILFSGVVGSATVQCSDWLWQESITGNMVPGLNFMVRREADRSRLTLLWQVCCDWVCAEKRGKTPCQSGQGVSSPAAYTTKESSKMKISPPIFGTPGLPPHAIFIFSVSLTPPPIFRSPQTQRRRWIDKSFLTKTDFLLSASILCVKLNVVIL